MGSHSDRSFAHLKYVQSCWVKRCFPIVLLFVSIGGFSHMLTQLVKVTAGRMRPDFVSRCLGLEKGVLPPEVTLAEFRCVLGILFSSCFSEGSCGVSESPVGVQQNN